MYQVGLRNSKETSILRADADRKDVVGESMQDNL